MMHIYRYHTFIRRLVFLSWIDFVVFLSAAIPFNFYIAFDGPFLPATYRLRSINFQFRVCRYSGLSSLLDLVNTNKNDITPRIFFLFDFNTISFAYFFKVSHQVNSSKFNSGAKGSWEKVFCVRKISSSLSIAALTSVLGPQKIPRQKWKNTKGLKFDCCRLSKQTICYCSPFLT